MATLATVPAPTELPPDGVVDGPDRDDAILETVRSRCARDEGHGWSVELDPSGVWVSAEPDGTHLPAQGWKLHVSAGLSSADEVLSLALDVLVGERVAFKVARSKAVLDQLNWGASGRSQVGKFMTVYPVDDAQAVRVAPVLHAATEGRRGPRIPSDRPVAPGSIVHYRYGAFATRYARLASGRVVPVIEDPDGALVEDTRLLDPPDWVVDPFVAATGAPAADEPVRAIGDRFVLTGTMVQTARGSVFLAVDLDGPDRCVVKHARRDSMLSATGSDARDRLRAEAKMLAALGEGPWPRQLALVDDGDDVFLAEEEIRGETLDAWITTRTQLGRHIDEARLVRWGIEVAEAVARIHDEGLVVRDLKAANIIVAAVDDSLRLIDLECSPRGVSTPEGTLASRGSSSPEQRAGAAPSEADDVFALGALLWFLASGANPGAAPDPTSLGDRPLVRLRPGLRGAVEQVIVTCLADDPTHRYTNARDVAGALATIAAPPRRPVVVHPPSRPGDRAATPWDAAVIRRLTTGLIERARRRPDGSVTWQAAGAPLRDLGHGDAGVVLALSAAARHGAGGDGRDGGDGGEGGEGGEVHALVRDGASGVLADAPGVVDASAGLLAGDVGIALAVLAAGSVLGDATLVDAALVRGAQEIDRPVGSAESAALVDGLAGRVRASLWLADATGEQHWLDRAVRAGDELRRRADPVDVAGRAGACWAGPPDPDDRRQPHPGYAVGAAGIADSLLLLAHATGAERFFDTACAGLRWVLAQAVPALDGDRGVAWPLTTGATGATTGRLGWYDGTVGVGTALLHALDLGVDGGPAGLDLAGVVPDTISADIERELDALVLACAATAAEGLRAHDATQADGLAGALELILDTIGSRIAGAERLAPAVADLGELLEAYVPDPAAHPHRIVPPPGYLDGTSGLLAVGLRLRDPNVPNVVGPRWWFGAAGVGDRL